MPEVPRVDTPFQEAAIAELLRRELVSQKLDPHQDMAALLLAQIAFETSHGRACQNHNVGNVTANEAVAVDYYRPKWFAEGQTEPHMQALHELMTHGHAPRAFRSFTAFPEGVAGYVRAARHLSCVEAARTGDADILADVIRSGGYTPGAPDTLGHTLDQSRNDYLRRGLFETLPKDHEGSGPDHPEPLS